MNAALWLLLFRGGSAVIIVGVVSPHPFLGGNVSYVVVSSTGSSFVALVHSGVSYIG